MKPEQPGYAVLPDMDDTKLLVDLTSYASDLSEASHTLAQALEAGEESPLRGPLTSHAVTAYIRPFILSKVRERLDEMPGIPAVPVALVPVHNLVRKYRNTTVAHSQSDLTMPVPVAVLDTEGQVVNVIGVSLVQPMPRVIAEQLHSLISVMEDIVEKATEPVRERLRAWSKQQSPEDVSRWQLPELVHAVDTDFTAGRKRSRSPRYTSYWHTEDPPAPDPMARGGASSIPQRPLPVKPGSD
ncbi:hypothetical protein QF031_003382 [Pseudarthrobacter defluvii]|uniref:hypothetical protein n=1 Tax=Pseudarthrobacter defluvii TaxID=410837 RepID=UPI00278668D5|nr:hypothetical protein [Pseudarthrobacter defluvii]MDQ0770633.1 hypothetical protein [Pseudarthrobacter defluvii]